ncbi:alpha/beta hydrolase-fold protein [Pontibacter harenae]|uniref:alpha/beta hydrolase-fold protein n=1 Tax=Pontibacter harenae TaxID=2894083 RepID=UPI001E428430|nr:alpha/beta hydrolase-fold protein [Pontibacter harenae]MCC9168991.1 alpha/beta hydrolase [Pontibacter harenae]
MKQLLLAAFFFAALPVYSQNGKIEIGIIDSLYSTSLGENRQVWVHVPAQPEGYEIFAPKRYPVLYLLDGDWHFQSVTGLLHFLSSENGASIVPEMIVVAVVNTDRTRDFTPTSSTKDWNGNEQRYLRNSGGGNKFTSFLEKELIPYIDSKYPTEQYRMLVGHSFGGLLVVNTLVEKPALFNAYVAIEPSLWWDDKVVLKKAVTAIQKDRIGNRKLFLAVADTVQASDNVAHIRANIAFARMLEKQKNTSLTWKYYKGENHFTVPLMAENDALRTLLKYEPLPIPGEGVEASAFHADYVRQHYTYLSDKVGYKMLPPEDMVFSFALACMNRKIPEKAYGFLKLNMENYPNSYNVYSSMGQYYERLGDKGKAIEFYEKALTIKDYPETINKLVKLRSSK